MLYKIESIDCVGRYVFLVDSQARVRWRGSGKASKDEVGYMLVCSKELLKEGSDTAQPPSAQSQRTVP